MKVATDRCIFSLLQRKEKDLDRRGEEKPPANRKKSPLSNRLDSTSFISVLATPSRERVHGPVASSHAGGMPAISRRLSAATPPEVSRKHKASQRDASARWVRHRRFGSLAGIPSGGGSFWTYFGGVAALNHRIGVPRLHQAVAVRARRRPPRPLSAETCPGVLPSSVGSLRVPARRGRGRVWPDRTRRTPRVRLASL